jgi:uncharacterized LabA/DUF88 family protein
MDRVAVFVDAGYVFAQGAALLTGKKQQRGDLTINAAKIVEALGAFAEKVSKVQLLRVYWYDGTSIGPTAQHLTLAHMPSVKVRLGFVNRAGEQKGVDSLVVTDMINLARNRAMTDAVLLSGDEDLRVGVQQAQEIGVKVHLLGIKPSRGSQSLFLLQEADSTHEWGEREVGEFLAFTPRDRTTSPTPTSSAAIAAAPAGAPTIRGDAPYAKVARDLAAEVNQEALQALVGGFKSSAQVPREFDARLLARARKVIGADLDAKQKREVRTLFIDECEKRLTGA